MARQFDRKLILEDGSEYYGYGFGATCDRVCELAFHTSMTGYQEIISDPSAAGMALVMTYPPSAATASPTRTLSPAPPLWVP